MFPATLLKYIIGEGEEMIASNLWKNCINFIYKKYICIFYYKKIFIIILSKRRKNMLIANVFVNSKLIFVFCLIIKMNK